MVLTRDSLYSLDALNVLNIVQRDDYETKNKGKGIIDLDHGSFINVIYVLGLVSNLLSVYQMNHTRSPKKVVFTPNDVEITEMSNGRVIAKGFVDHSSKVYNFSHFLPFSNPSSLLTYSSEARNICPYKLQLSFIFK